MEKWPVEYHLEVYESSWVNDASICWHGTNPFPALSVGEYFEHRTYERWYEPPKEGQRFKIKDIEHIFWEVDNSHIGHKLMVLLEVVDEDKFAI